MSVEERVRKVAAEHFGLPLDQIALSGRLIDDYEFDSLDYIEFAMSLEEEFQCRELLDDDKVRAATTLQDFVVLMQGQHP